MERTARVRQLRKVHKVVAVNRFWEIAHGLLCMLGSTVIPVAA
jgi:hypothetical protein